MDKLSTIVIDEPEIALHPDVQKRLMERLKFHSKTKQIIVSTHSPYFIDLNLLTCGNFYGWGVGRADRIEHFVSILNNLNYKKIVIILDNDKEDLGKKLITLYPNYKIVVIDAKDIRNKKAPIC